ncbi:MAG: prepilin-type N-terminal cleavage/methylation domain-containing protein [Candidatus Hydrogenedentes bacterium]|nr:prepilin-type N-terminal cleavage/methylation domain-containing protein [Candidatus Hydrogenedentota bacterium]
MLFLKSLNEKVGFSLVEVLVSMAVLAVGIVAVTRLFPQGLRATRVAQERTIAAELADSNLARLRMAGMDNLLGVMRASALYNTSAAAAAYGDGFTGDGVVEGFSTNITRAGLNDNLVRVTFSVEMPDGRLENFVTYVTQY